MTKNRPPNPPSPKKVLRARQKAGLTQAEAAAVIYCAERSWQDWEGGRRQMPAYALELFMLKTGQVTLASKLPCATGIPSA